MADPLDIIARICNEQPHDALTQIADALGYTEQREQEHRAAVLGEAWDALDKLYADTEPEDPRRKGISAAASVIAAMKRAAGVSVDAGKTDRGQTLMDSVSRIPASSALDSGATTVSPAGEASGPDEQPSSGESR